MSQRASSGHLFRIDHTPAHVIPSVATLLQREDDALVDTRVELLHTRNARDRAAHLARAHAVHHARARAALPNP